MNVDEALEGLSDQDYMEVDTALSDLTIGHTEITRLIKEKCDAVVSEKSVRDWRKVNTDYKPLAQLPTPEEIQEENDRVALKKQLAVMARKAENNKVSRQDLIEAVYEGVYAAAVQLNFSEIVPPVPQLGPDEEVAVAVLGDWQLGKTTPDYNSVVCEERIEKYAQKVVQLTEIQRKHHPVNKLVVLALGDMVEGELIFPGQHYLIDSSAYQQTVVDGPRILTNFLRTMLDNFTEVEFYGVIGNHGQMAGRSAGSMNKESNLDRMMYQVARTIMAKEDRITWTIPDNSTGIDGPREANWYTVAKVGNYSTLLLHGDQFSSLTVTAVQRKVAGWALALEHFVDVDFGHWHTPTMLTFNRIQARGNGSPESRNTYAIEKLAAIGYPSQGLRFVHPEKGIVTASYTVWIEK